MYLMDKAHLSDNLTFPGSQYEIHSKEVTESLKASPPLLDVQTIFLLPASSVQTHSNHGRDT